ncbi:sensor histidine kinase [Flavobacterium sp.]|uniref:sensor histidine kinase n=1 Tax=Flavobacterium sp. TaxID=239 RepID=UPI002614A738|nr:sensor histidine kinase [Flavobacterium sp.]
MRKSKQTRIRLTFIFAIVFLLSLSVYCYLRISDLNRSFYWVNHTNQVKLELESFASTIKDVELAQRGYLLTRDSVFLDEFQTQLDKVSKKLIFIRKIVADNRQQETNLKILGALTTSRLAAIKHVVSIGSIEKIPYAQRMKYREQRKFFRNHISKMMEVEESNLRERTRFMQRQSSLTPVFTILLMISALFALVFSYYAINRELKISDFLKGSLEERKQELIEKNKTLQSNNKDLETVNKELEAFTYISSHDLQEPLRKIQTLISVVIEKESALLTESGKNYLERIRTSSERMKSLIQDLLAYSRVNVQVFPVEDCSLQQIVDEVKEDLEDDIEEKNAVIHVHGEANVKIIPMQFRQLLTNLVANSLKFSRQGVVPKISIKNDYIQGSEIDSTKAALAIDYSRITISDNGIGFDLQYRDRIFDVFQRLYSDQQYAGTGIGLAIVKKIVENHKGFITVDSVEGQGTTFSVYLPA